MELVRKIPVVWALVIGLVLATLVGILIVTRDLQISHDVFADGVTQAKKVDSTTDDALDGAAQLPPANAAIVNGMPEVLGVVDSLKGANQTLLALSDQLHTLGSVLDSADPSLVGIIGSAENATGSAEAAASEAAGIVTTLSGANTKVGELGGLLDRTQQLSSVIDSKLRIALLLPKLPPK